MKRNKEIKHLQVDDIDANKLWDKFVFSNLNATFFHRAGWQRVINKVFNHPTYFLYVECSGVVEGILPLAHVKSILFGNSLVSLPFAVYGGVVALNEETATALELAAQELANSLNVDHLELRNLDQRHFDWPAQDIYVTFRKSILPTEEENLLAIPRKQRAMIRKGIKNGLSSLISLNVDDFFKLYSDNVHRHGTPAMSRNYFLTLINEFGNDCEILTIFSNTGAPLSSVFSFYFRDEVLPYYAGDDVSARELAANDFKYWELLRRACASGLKTFDYGRSKVETGSFAFKKNWGFEPKPLCYEYCLYKRDSIPQNNPSNKKYKLLISIWKRLPIPVANTLGPFIVKNLG
ncbi:FemAB family XrtA/PEP-CTERM system-associated protein [Rhodoferax sp.]|uniref:FemAB family XrtA/PEP-CTERM system-associated protein n=1 Tax=Rhodoferax sp. TaxID=50421 RepID=UPI0025EF47BF|nr:FemAB family XrtA/PEP-CTERM system-associated protein [Rhodoferax sp.]